jgi:hypothetical protein
MALLSRLRPFRDREWFAAGFAPFVKRAFAGEMIEGNCAAKLTGQK